MINVTGKKFFIGNLSEERVNAGVDEDFLEVLQIFGVQSFCVGKFIIATEHVVFIFAELMEGQKLHALCSDLFKSLNETFCVKKKRRLIA